MSDAGSHRIDRIQGTGIPIHGDNIDTDRIIPARYLKAVSFDGLEAHVFADDRRALAGAATLHPFDDARFRGASILIVTRNFGCGSSREHAPQALRRWGIQAVVGESFSEIFFGNALTLGLPCFKAAHADIQALMRAVEADPGTAITLSVAEGVVAVEGLRVAAEMSAAARTAFLEGLWDATGLLLDRFDEVETVAKRLPYVNGF